MANELTLTASLAFAKGNVASNALAVTSGRFTVSGTRYEEGVQTVPTSAGGTAINLGAMAGTIGYCMFKNLDNTNYVEILTAVSGTAVIKLKPGEVALVRLAGAVTAPAALANTASVQLQYLIVED